jgi:iron complex outermembrane receptor protein
MHPPPLTETMKRFDHQTKALVVLLSLLQPAFLYAQEGQLKGMVKNENEPLEAATVSVANKTVLTDKNGKFSLSVLPGTYVLIITHTSYNKVEQQVTIIADHTQQLNFVMTPISQLGEVVVLGSRSLIARTNLNTPVPVDVFSSEKLEQTSQQDLIQMLNFSASSLNQGSRQTGNEPVTLRGLDPDHVLILVNGIRYHNPAWLNNGVPKSDLGRGSVGNDLNSIPFAAIDKVEILRDGASAQYGSDAIAGVINIRLKESTGKTSIQSHLGQFYMGDGLKATLRLNNGVALNKKGFLNYAAEIWSRGSTSREGEYTGTVYYPYPSSATAADSARVRALDDSTLKARGINRRRFSGNDGIVEVKSYGLLINGGYPITSRSFLFWTGSFNQKFKNIMAIYRFPNDSMRVNTDLYPDGFKPEVENSSCDALFMTGLKIDTRNKWHCELSSSYGSNSNSFNVSNSNNASQYYLGKNAPTAFYLGNLFYSQFINNVSFAKDLAKQKRNLKSCNLAMGAEWRLEHYRQKGGDSASWYDYDSTGPRQGGSQPSNGSINPKNAVHKDRSVMAAYVDIETETKNQFLIDLAGRYEYYSDYGGNLAGKVALRYKISEKFSLRASLSNGFRAPALQQLYYEGTQSFRGTSMIQGIFSNISPVTKAFDIPSLESERSVNIGGGVTAKLSHHVSVTVDAYWIQIKNRLILSGVFGSDNPDVAKILVNYPNVNVVQFYTNAINTRTRGVDGVLNGNWRWNKTRLGLTLAANFNRNALFGPIKTTDKISDTSKYTNTLFGIEERTALTNDQPKEKIISIVNISKGKFGLRLGNTFFGSTATATIHRIPPIDTAYEFFSSRILTDLSINYTPISWMKITIGANNLFDVYPDRLKSARTIADWTYKYSYGATPFGCNGGYYYLEMSFNF